MYTLGGIPLLDLEKEMSDGESMLGGEIKKRLMLPYLSVTSENNMDQIIALSWLNSHNKRPGETGLLLLLLNNTGFRIF